ncbi:glycoside hydrolase family 97 protein [Neptunitalea lumnitzerae]|uniref:Alpha-glucosidase n=1 Tax=Neptunitalea lumnitzerae TaxID=2965509 RepID=A0ABQ5MLL5_9FLAO|nr:glycoside hydrolase family 97 protein [Neptunitalea sp. Y10]GLB50308.1 alpha-glucosidase [Neptunitalea sp. Y10]
MMLYKNGLRVAFILAALAISSCTKSNQTSLQSPDTNIAVNFSIDKGLEYEVAFKNDTILKPSSITLSLEKDEVFNNFEMLGTESTSVNSSWERVWGRSKQVQNTYNQLLLHLKDKESELLVDVYCRVYDDGIAFRYGFPEQTEKSITLSNEQTKFVFTDDYVIWRANYKTYKSSQEQEFKNGHLSDISSKELIGMPALLKVHDSAYAFITEANLTDWSGAFLKTDSVSNTLVTKLTPNPQDTLVAVQRETPAVSPWRVLMLADSPGAFIASDLIANLNEPVAFEDTSWIKPGRAAWDWWWSNKYAKNIDFELGANQKTYEYYIDLAAEMGWEYQIVDWQWYGEPFTDDNKANPDVDITTSIDAVDIPALVAYAKERNVKLILWLHWEHLNKQMEEALAQYEQWGIAGIKVDFMDRQDQEMVNFYHTAVKTAAKHHLVVDLHGAYKPTGISRTYPNLMTREGVMGNEYNKWSDYVTPEHNVTLAFTRGALGEMDYTPGSFVNVRPDQFVTEDKAEEATPMVMSTRCQQLAMPVVYESAFTVFCDAPDHYKNGLGADFLKEVPTTWDATKVLNGVVGDYITVARQSGDTWFVGGMTDATAREVDVKFSFLDEGSYTLTLYSDAEDANENPTHVKLTEQTISQKDVLHIAMASGGGFAAIIKKME